jgi:hypothetical protein
VNYGRIGPHWPLLTTVRRCFGSTRGAPEVLTCGSGTTGGLLAGGAILPAASGTITWTAAPRWFLTLAMGYGQVEDGENGASHCVQGV